VRSGGATVLQPGESYLRLSATLISRSFSGAFRGTGLAALGADVAEGGGNAIRFLRGEAALQHPASPP
jgi:hypothetical protein